jgi:2-C-methyl-D-erythritol 2,4-cyclodiphosphate synthase
MDHPIRTGIGYDIHRLVEGRKLILGGIEIVFERGLAGHSDADVLAHSICDALLGAACLGDIGTHFPDSDPAFRGISSMELLSNVIALVRERGYQVVNVDSVVLAERPKLGPFISQIRNRLAEVLGIGAGCVSIKAKTCEGLDAIGRGEAIAAQSVVLISLGQGN